MVLKNLKKYKIPDGSGVYFFKKGVEILYIGKATSLKDRVKSYFNTDIVSTRGPIIMDMVSKSDKIKWQETDNVLEALILEAALIKKYQPKYNTKEKSDKSFNYVCITKTHLRYSVDALPRVLVVRGKDINYSMFSKIFGPFTNGGQLKEALKIIRRIFPFLDEKTNSYKFYKQIDLVPDISNKEGIKKYKNDIKNLILFFEGKKKNVVSNLKKEMISYAKNKEFEKAGEVKKQLFAIQHINDVALIRPEISNQSNSLRRSHSILEGQEISGCSEYSSENNSVLKKTFRVEAYDVAHMGGKNMVGVMVSVLNGEVEKNGYKKFKIKTQNNTNDTGALREILERRLAHTEWQYPDLVVIDGGTAQINMAKKVFKVLNMDIPLVSVLKDERHKPKDILGDKKLAQKYEKEILLANNEAHRFAINYHKNMRNKNFLK